MSSVRVIQNITKEYPDMFKIILYKEPKYYVEPENRFKRKKSEVSDDYTPTISSLNRTKTLIRDIVLCNDFELFATFTFDPKKADRFNYYSCYHKMSTWIHHQKERSPDLTYLVVPEQHKSGAWHFHALISHYNGTLRDSKHFSSSGRRVYNLTSYRSGFTTAVFIDNKDAVANYVTKYITKDFIKSFNQRRFFCSRNLRRPVKTINSSVFSVTPPLFRQKLSDFDNVEIYNVAKF